MVRDLRAQAQVRKAEVAAIAKEAAAIVKEADTFVKDLARGSARRHIDIWGGVAPAKVKAAPPKPAPPVAEIPEEAPAEAPAAEAVPAGELRDRVFSYLADHPDGAKLVEIEEALGIARIRVANVIRELIDDNKVEKREMLYFAI